MRPTRFILACATAFGLASWTPPAAAQPYPSGAWSERTWQQLVGPEQGVKYFVDGHDVHLSYHRFGDATSRRPALLLLMGLGETETAWDPAFLAPLAKGREVVIFSWPGIGDSGIDDFSGFSVELLADATHLFAVGIGLDRPDLLGYAFGGKVAAVMLARHPESYGRFVDVAGNVNNPPGHHVEPALLAALTSTNPARLLLSAFPDTAEGRAALRQTVIRQLSHRQEPRQLEALRAFRGVEESWEAEQGTIDLGAIRNATLIVAGDLDRVTPLPALLAAPRLFPAASAATVVVLSGCSHTVLYQERESVLANVLPFLDRVTGP